MFDNLAGKKLLILGGIPRTCFLVKRAKMMGVYVIVADFDENSPAKKIADEAILVDATDVNALTKYCKEYGVDGVTTAFVDFLMPVCLEVAKNCGMPCYMTETMIKVSTDKNAFKKMCNEYDVPVPKSFEIIPENLTNEALDLPYPVFVKPFDGSGSRGANVCYNSKEFESSYKEALKWSKKGGAVVEQYLTGTDIGLDYLLIDGEPYLLSMWDRLVTDGRPSAINHADLQILPSRYLKKYSDDLDGKVRKMFKSMGFNNGIIFLQGYANDKGITFFEMGCRLGGTWCFIDEHYIGANPIDMLIHHALTGKMVNDITKLSLNPDFYGKAAVMSFISGPKEGKIDNFKGVEEIAKMPEAVCVWPLFKEGDTYKTLSDTAFLRLQLVSDDYSKLKSCINHIYSLIEISDSKGNSLLSPFYNTEKLDKNYT